MELCEHCLAILLSSNKIERVEQPPESSCFLCGGSMASYIANLSNSQFNYPAGSTSFYISIASSPQLKAIMDKEEAHFPCTATSIKTVVRDKSLSIISSKTPLVPDFTAPDVTYKLSFPQGLLSSKSNPIYIYGKYKKLTPGISQKRWAKYGSSVEAIIGEKLSDLVGAKEYYMHASGREDVDAINTAGRPFVMELVEPTTRELDLVRAQESIGRDGMVAVSLLGFVPPSFTNVVTDSHGDKCYRAYIDKELSEQQRSIISSFKGIIEQRTPTRVKHRRADKVRRRMVYSVIPGKDSRGPYLDICAEAGTYIKEFISGDAGRTVPSVSSLISLPISCSFLVVTNVSTAYIDRVFSKQRLG